MGRSTRLNILDRERAVVVLMLLSLRDPINPMQMQNDWRDVDDPQSSRVSQAPIQYCATHGFEPLKR